jgi:3-deoxy-manno-octulosonate cytidylyltransferase (CMP-KDO synthetase)
MGSSRFPGKPLKQILGISMIEHVYRRTAMSAVVDEVYVATCDQEIFDETERFGGKAIMTSTVHQRASDRTAEAAEHIEGDIIVMVQGDEPMTVPDMIDSAVQPLLDDESVICSNLAKRIETVEEMRDPNTIKVALDLKGDALYFSREPIPTVGVIGFENVPVFKQVCIMPFRREALKLYTELEPTPLEQAESVDMMRYLEHGYKVRLIETPYLTHAVDTADDLAMVEARMRDDPLNASYLGESS